MQKRDRKALYIGFAVIFLTSMFFAGIIFAGYNYLTASRNLQAESMECNIHKSSENAESKSAGISSVLTGIAALDKWNIENSEMEYEALRKKYIELYKFAYPYLLREAVRQEVIPEGKPTMYGEELKISFSGDINKAIAVMRKYDEHPLNDEQFKRYKNIALNISCEYCCNAKALIFENGEKACGCAHSSAMRGLAKYLILNHAEHYTDEQILNELQKWKAVFFPKQTISKAIISYAKAGKIKIDPSILKDMPDMVGSC